MLSYRELLDTRVDPASAVRALIKRMPIVIEPDSPLRLADNLMSRYNVDHLIVTDPEKPDQAIGVITESDMLAAHRRIA